METFILYLQLGFEHILPCGFDHILFVVCLFLLSTNLKTLIYQASAFTIAHSITLAIAMLDFVTVPSKTVEPIIALSIVYVAFENVFCKKLQPSRIMLVFIFGLVHGLGFAGGLASLGVPQGQFLSSLIGFNIGVELGQLIIILAAWYFVGKWFSTKEWYRKRLVIPTSLAVAATGIYWTIERIFF